MNNKINQLLALKEQHYLIQQQTYQKYCQPIITFNLNIPGANKQAKIYHDFFITIKKDLFLLLEQNQINYQVIEQRNDLAGNFLILTLTNDYDCKQLKRMLVEKEIKNPSYQIVDIDVFDKNNKKIYRTDVNYPLKKCYLCMQAAKICARKKTHDVSLLLAHIKEILEKFF